MGHWSMSIHGAGQHDNKLDNDADVLLRDFIQKLRSKGHDVTAACFTAGSQKVIVTTSTPQENS